MATYTKKSQGLSYNIPQLGQVFKTDNPDFVYARTASGAPISFSLKELGEQELKRQGKTPRAGTTNFDIADILSAGQSAFQSQTGLNLASLPQFDFGSITYALNEEGAFQNSNNPQFAATNDFNAFKGLTPQAGGDIKGSEVSSADLVSAIQQGEAVRTTGRGPEQQLTPEQQKIPQVGTGGMGGEANLDLFAPNIANLKEGETVSLGAAGVYRKNPDGSFSVVKDAQGEPSTSIAVGSDKEAKDREAELQKLLRQDEDKMAEEERLSREVRLQELKKQLGIGVNNTNAPTTPSLVETFNKQLASTGVNGLQSQLTGINQQIADVTQQLREATRTAEGRLAPLSLISSEQSEISRRATDTLSQLNNQRALIQEQLNFSMSMASTIAQLTQTDFQNTSAQADREFNRAFQIMDFIRSEEATERSILEQRQDRAMANLTATANLISEGGIDIASLPASLQSDLRRLEIEAGLPSGFVDNLLVVAKTTADKPLTIQKSADGTTFSVLYQNKDGSLRTETIGTGLRPEGGSGVELTPKQITTSIQLSNSLKAHPAYSDMLDIQTGIKGVETGLAQENGFGDITAINAFQRMVDPGATVRAEDVVLLQSASAYIFKVLSDYPIEKLQKGSKLPDPVRQQLLKTAQDLYEVHAKGYNETVGNQYKKLSEAAGLPFEYIGAEFPTKAGNVQNLTPTQILDEIVGTNTINQPEDLETEEVGNPSWWGRFLNVFGL